MQPGNTKDAGTLMEGGDALAHLQVGNGEDDRVHEEDAAGLLIDGGCNDLRVHHQGGAPWAARARFTCQLHCGILSGQEETQVVVEDEDNFDHPWGGQV